uniref:Non-specific serine/threonine protein kinase n=1 Tax=Syphacia muris TaxID=451379 RepID=A0A0N5AE21_9BILA
MYLKFLGPLDEQASFALSSAPQTLDFYIAQNGCSSSVIPRNYSIYWKCDFIRKHNVTIQQCFYPFGSTRLLIYFLAHAVDNSSDCEVQAMALKLLLIYVRRGSLVRMEFSLSKGCDIILRCFSSPFARIGSSTVKVKRGGDRFEFWVELVEVISGCLLSSGFLLAQFNKAQLCRTKFLTHFLHACQRMSREIEDFPLASDDADKAVDYATKIVSNLIDSNKTVDNILLLWDFILLSHPAVDTYLNSKIRGHIDWIKTEYLKDDRQERVLGESVLARRLRDYACRLGKEKIAENWARKRSVVALRKLYEETVMSNDDNESTCNSEFFAARMTKNFIYLGIANILSNIIRDCTSSMIIDLFKTMTWHSICVLLTNQENEAFRDAVFFLLQNFMLRAPLNERQLFVKECGFAILGNQLRGYPVSTQIADSLFSLCCGTEVHIDEGLTDADARAVNVDQFNCFSFDAIFALWEESATLATVPIFWNISSAILKVLLIIFEHNSLLMQAMMDAQLCDVLVGVLRKIASVPVHGTKHCEMCQRMILLLECALLEIAKAENYSSERKIRKALCLVLNWWMDTLQTMFVDRELSPNHVSNVETLPGRSVSPMAALVYGSFTSLREKIASIGDQMECKYKWRVEFEPPSTAEIINRVLFGLSAISNLFIMIYPSDISVFNITMWSSFGGCWKEVLMSCRDRARFILSQLLAYFVFPAEEKLGSGSFTDSKQQMRDLILKRRLLVISMFANDILYNPMLKTLLDINLDYQYTMNLALHELATVEEIDQSSVDDIEKLIKFLRQLQIESPFANLSEERLLSLTTDEKLSLHSYLEARNNFLLTMRQKTSAIADDEQIYTEQLKQLAMSETCVVVDSQNLLRKKYVRDYREFEIKMLRADEILSELAVQFCHPEAACHDPFSWPQSWELDPTEGPNRERRRLTPVHLRFDRQFLLPQYEHKLRNRERLPPLSNLLCGRRSSTKEWNMMESLAPGERIITAKQATVVRSTVESQGEVLIGDKKFYFFGSGTRTTQKGIVQVGTIVLTWDYDQVIEVYKRHNFLKDRALEIFFADGQTYLIAFETVVVIRERDHFLNSLLSMDLPNLIYTPQNLQATTQLWREGSITNFEYLMQLNKLAGRSFNDLMQYPVFPFVLADYISETINLTDATIYRCLHLSLRFVHFMKMLFTGLFRCVTKCHRCFLFLSDLGRPMAIQNKNMEQHYLHNYTCLEQERERAFLTHSTTTLGPYHYGSHYSNSGIVVHYLVRLPPFTEIALEYQDNSFDIPDRLFNSIATTWRLSSSESTTDFKELIPEFFYCHEFLVNREGLNLGVRQNGDIVNDVILPKWCLGNPRLFILVHRQALESLFVTASLHLWIDLIFGFKQTGSAAVQAINVFHPATYRGGLSALESSEIDPISVDALETMVRTYGQMPTQLFLSPHLPHMTAKTVQLSAKKAVKSPISSVMRVRWGEFVGSPDSDFGEPVADLKQPPSLKFGHLSHLSSFSDNICYAYPDKTLLLPWIKTLRSKETRMVGLLSWRFSDFIARVCVLGLPTITWRNAIDLCNFQVTTAAFLPTDGLLFLALSGGVVRVYRICFEDEASWDCVFLRELFAHESGVTTISLSSEYAIAVTGCARGKVCVWDTNKLSYVRTIFFQSQFSVILSCVSATTGDIAVFLQSSRECFNGKEKKLNIVKLFTINGDLVGESEVEASVTAMTMTNLPEGTAVNCLVLGLESGIVRLVVFLNMWTMGHLTDFLDVNYMEPVVRLLLLLIFLWFTVFFTIFFSLSFCCRCTRLYACLSSGSIISWRGDSLNIKRSAKLVAVASNGSYEESFVDETE